MIDNEYYEKVYRLEYIIRYSNVPRIHDESVASHSFYVAAIVMKLWDDYDFDLGLALQIAISHDVPEYITNDLSHETKAMFPEIKEMLLKAETKALDTMPVSIQAGHAFYNNPALVETRIVHLADAVQCNQYAKHEIQLGNRGYMTDVERGSRNRAIQLIMDLQNHRKQHP